MSIKCSLLGHAFEASDVEREREERGSEVVTVVRELERCRRCGAERVVAENTEVAAVVDADEVDVESDGAAQADEPVADAAGPAEAADPDPGPSTPAEETAVVDEVDPDDGESAEIIEDDGDATPEPADEDTAAASSAAEETPDVATTDADAMVGADSGPDPAADPSADDGEIIGEGSDRDPGEWPDDPVDELTETGTAAQADPATNGDDGKGGAQQMQAAPTPEIDTRRGPDDEELAGITVPEGEIVCPDCGFQIDSESSYRDGDPCPECGAWLIADNA